MRDYYFVASDGSETAVADLPTNLIHDHLAHSIGAQAGAHTMPDNVRERLLLELFIREKDLRK